MKVTLVQMLTILSFLLNVSLGMTYYQLSLLKNKSGVITSGGWGNGYVRIPEGHPFYGKEYNEIDVSVHGGLTFSEHVTITDGDVLPEGFWIGFDTFHHGDDSIYWTERRVLEETIHLFSQVYGLSN